MGPYFDRIGVLIRRRDTKALSLSLPPSLPSPPSAQRKGHTRPHEKAGIYKAGRNPSPDMELAQTSTMDLSSPEVWTNKCLMLKPSSPWYFVMGA